MDDESGGEITVEYDVEAVRGGVKFFLRLSISLFVLSFVVFWASWSLLAALAIVTLMIIAWLIGALFAISIVPRDLY